MSPNKGGRPRNQWTSCRQRRLIRLYSLTTLDINEIQCVLKAHQFNPSSSDIQKKLRDLLPGDYAKNWRSFRPAKGQPMSRRLDAIRTKRYREQNTPDKRRTSGPEGRNLNSCHVSPSLEIFEGPSTAFRNYLGPNDAIISYQHSTNTEGGLESQIVEPSRLLLDGSSICSNKAAASQPRPSYEPAEQTFLNPVSSNKTRILVVPVARPRDSLPSIRSLQERLKRTGSIIQSIHSVLRFSSTESWRSSISTRSSIISFESLLQTQKAVNSCMSGPSPSSPAAENVTPTSSSTEKTTKQKNRKQQRRKRPAAIKSEYGRAHLSEHEEKVWNDLIKGDAPLGPFDARPEFREMSLKGRPCCGSTLSLQVDAVGGFCPQCGIRQSHRHAISNFKLFSHSINEKDYFNNGMLHFAAACPHWTADEFIIWIREGADIKSVNTSGATFLHILTENLVSEHLPEFLKLVLFIHNLDKLFPHYFDGIKFDLSCRDYHGQTVLHMLFHNPDFLQSIRPEGRSDFEQLVEIMAPDVGVIDNLGRTLGHMLGDRINQASTKLILSTRQETDFITHLKSSPFRKRTWLGWLEATDRVTWVDTNGDTALIALLKTWTGNFDADPRPSWSYKDAASLSFIVKEVVKSGAVVHMRDRAGDTALAIAARRGLRSAVTALLDGGACVNSQNYIGVSIIEGACREIRRAITATMTVSMQGY
ncbi:uncharacterized protein LY89DRAFT_737466 [Mollisia scopiformis]|uniref:Uncharacterized protein n=1 Tax=Mollisia scopiformis TaxID=149040 RepID=A0A194X0U8_MOLSC|nr:uncharacterized protein LY89DRAFT_737466 [Mollisia scopiformis]KUJ13487.1 hypothetical protein LY89DRAFT_737466 [Mollisia scopiformis]